MRSNPPWVRIPPSPPRSQNVIASEAKQSRRKRGIASSFWSQLFVGAKHLEAVPCCKANPSLPNASPLPLHSLAFHLTIHSSSYNIATGRARRGASGALYPQSATAGLNSLLRPAPFWDCFGKAALKAGSCAAGNFEPRQIREEATVRRPSWVTQGCLAGAGCLGKPGSARRKRVHDHFLCARRAGTETRATENRS